MESAINKLVFQSFKLKGLSLTSDASKALVKAILAVDDDNNVDYQTKLGAVLDDIKSRIEKREIKSTVIDINIIESIVADLSFTEEDLKHDSIQLFDSYDCPKLVYDEKLRTYSINSKLKYNLLAEANARPQMYRERLILTIQRLLRSGLFINKGLNSNSNRNDDVHEISTIESLLGSSGSHLLVGMITQPEEGIWYLEDMTSALKLNLDNAIISDGMLTEGSQVIALGEYNNEGYFDVQNIGFPPAEDRIKTLTSLGISDNLNMSIRPQQLAHLEELESQSVDTMFVIISDIQLEKAIVQEKLQQLFNGFESSGTYPLFILLGSFVTKSATVTGGRENAKKVFSTLADIISNCPGLAQEAKFIIVPGPRDPGINRILPRRGIPSEYTKDLTKKVKNITFTSNPSRLKFYTQEIVIFRENILRTMQKYRLTKIDDMNDKEPKDIDNTNEQLVLSVLDQGHLWPLPGNAKPIIWDLDHTLRLTPLPHLLILGDHVDQYSYDYSGCKTVNPGSFATDFSFIVYRPATKEVEFSRIPN